MWLALAAFCSVVGSAERTKEKEWQQNENISFTFQTFPLFLFISNKCPNSRTTLAANKQAKYMDMEAKKEGWTDGVIDGSRQIFLENTVT